MLRALCDCREKGGQELVRQKRNDLRTFDRDKAFTYMTNQNQAAYRRWPN